MALSCLGMGVCVMLIDRVGTKRGTELKRRRRKQSIEQGAWSRIVPQQVAGRRSQVARVEDLCRGRKRRRKS